MNGIVDIFSSECHLFFSVRMSFVFFRPNAIRFFIRMPFVLFRPNAIRFFVRMPFVLFRPNAIRTYGVGVISKQ